MNPGETLNVGWDGRTQCVVDIPATSGPGTTVAAALSSGEVTLYTPAIVCISRQKNVKKQRAENMQKMKPALKKR